MDMVLFKVAQQVNPNFKIKKWSGKGTMTGRKVLAQSLFNTQLFGKSNAAFIAGCLSTVMLIIPVIAQTLGTGLELATARALTAGRDWAEGWADKRLEALCKLLVAPVMAVYLLTRLANTLISMVINPRNMYDTVRVKTGSKKFAALVGFVGMAGAITTGLYSGMLLLPTAMSAMPGLCAGALNSAGAGFTFLRGMIMTVCSSSSLVNFTSLAKSVKQAAPSASKAFSGKRQKFIEEAKEGSNTSTADNAGTYKPPTQKGPGKY